MSGQILHASCPCGFYIEILQGFQSTGAYLLPAACEECREFLVQDYHHPRCPGCGKRPIFFGEMDHKFLDFIMFEEKHKFPQRRSYHPSAYSERTLAMPMAGNHYGCPKCGGVSVCNACYIGFLVVIIIVCFADCGCLQFVFNLAQAIQCDICGLCKFFRACIWVSVRSNLFRATDFNHFVCIVTGSFFGVVHLLSRRVECLILFDPNCTVSMKLVLLHHDIHKIFIVGD